MSLSMENEKAGASGGKNKFREYFESIVIALLLALLIRAVAVQAFKIPSGSMKQTLLIGDHILVNKFIYGLKIPFTNKDMLHFGDPKHGDIIVFRYPEDPSKDFIKRVIGEPGDRIRIRDKVVFLNGEKLDESYVQHTDPRILPGTASVRDNMDTITVPPGHYFVMGDNRDESYDSRFWKFVDRSAVKGKAFIIYFSWHTGGEFSLDSDRSIIRWNRIGDGIH